MTPTNLGSTTLFLLLSVTLALLRTCPGPPTEGPHEKGGPVRARLGQEFNLRVGQQAAVEGMGFRIRFASVVNDSRCPTDVTCVWAGNAEVLIAAEASGSSASLKLNTQGGDNFPNEGKHQQYIVRLVGLSPHPRKNGEIKATDYVATLMIRKE